MHYLLVADTGPLLNITLAIGTVLGICVMLGVAYAITRTSAKTQTESIYEKENQALGKALSRQEQENVRLQTKVDALANANAVLQETVSGTIAIKELAKEITREETERRNEHQTQMILLKDIIAELRQSRGEIGR